MSKKQPITPWGKEKRRREREETRRKVEKGGGLIVMVIQAISAITAKMRFEKSRANLMNNIDSMGKNNAPEENSEQNMR